MRVVILIAIVVVAFVWFDRGSSHYDSNSPYIEAVAPTSNSNEIKLLPKHTFECDGRTYCSQMTSCEEAKFFLRNCPDPKMDGNGDGVPCERQWCH